ncbi:hypothetical protein Q4506_14990 [Colwellia sp. 4_MG-2023]|jgi:hypothetical protein|uniref:hypothetical protein n=1 Tax=unclassified Colwellia TaxID=196834 RepID=UPI0026E19D12|nr:MULTISPECIES: hypothetical protein [unclassified Colwellia]MDO6489041.1 hypothetical protein [Colwellia sp. 6_MG-2023]MDO6508364.1 hypothetical protein [Colwellia sp. 5_MG-2023]MDO6556990.1 hypothetical protein [Colwellia sp. 4_MG-2023]
MQTKKVTLFLKEYLSAFAHYDLNKAATAYYLPCTLHTPDQVVLVTDIKACQQELTKIFNQLQQAKTSDILIKKASYSLVTDHLFLMSVDWEFLDEKGEIFADFCAIYHLILVDNKLKIINVVSHDLSNSQTLDHPVMLTGSK